MTRNLNTNVCRSIGPRIFSLSNTTTRFVVRYIVRGLFTSILSAKFICCRVRQEYGNVQQGQGRKRLWRMSRRSPGIQLDLQNDRRKPQKSQVFRCAISISNGLSSEYMSDVLPLWFFCFAVWLR